MLHKLIFVFSIVVLSSCVTIKKNDEFVLRGLKESKETFADLRNGIISPKLRNISDYAFLSSAAYVGETFEGQCQSKVGKNWRWHLVEFEDGKGKMEVSEPTWDNWLEKRILEKKKQSPRRSARRVEGLGFQLWRDHASKSPPKFALVFRGTDLNEQGDWRSNARWFNGANYLIWDQYEQVRELTGIIKAELVKRYPLGFEVIAVGHSLGGGLAQHAAYSWEKIKTVYAFNTSPVTGAFSSDPRITKNKRQKLDIFRIYESGEILSPIRTASRVIIGLKQSSPKITELRFDFRSTLNRKAAGSGLLGQHSIDQLACDLNCRVDRSKTDEQCRTGLASL